MGTAVLQRLGGAAVAWNDYRRSLEAHRWSLPLRYGIAVLVVLAAAGVRVFIDLTLAPQHQPPFIVFFGAVLIAGTLAGFGPSLVAAALGALIGWYYFYPPARTVDFQSEAVVFGTIFLAEAVVIAATIAALEFMVAQLRTRGAELDEERATFELAESAGHLGMWEWNIETGEVRWSPALEAVAGLLPGEFGRSIDAITRHVHPDDLARVQEEMVAALKGGEYQSDFRIVRPSGEVRWLDSRGRVERDAQGRAVRMVGIGVDITDRHLAEESMRSSEERFRRMANASPVMIWTAGPDMSMTFLNERWEAFRGVPAEVDIAGGGEAAIHPDDRDTVMRQWAEHFERREPLEFEYRLLSASGEYRWVLDRGTPTYSTCGEFTGYVGSALDFHEQRAAREGQRFLSDAGVALSASLEGPHLVEARMQALADVTVSRFADLCMVFLRDEAEGYQRVATKISPSIADEFKNVEVFGRYDERASSLVRAGIESGRVLYLPDIEAVELQQYGATEEYLAGLRRLGIRSAICVPLRARGRVLGALLFVRTGQMERFAQADVVLAEELGWRAALAADNGRLHSGLEGMAEGLQHANEALTLNAEVGAALGSSLDTHTAMQAFAELCVPAFADWAGVAVIADDGHLSLSASAHRDEELGERFEGVVELVREMARDGDQSAEAMLLRDPQFVPEVTDAWLGRWSRQPEHLARVQEVKPRSAISIPLIARGRTLGSLMFVRVEGSAAFTKADFARAQDFARRAAIAVDNARLYGERQLTAAGLARANANLQFLSDAGNVLAGASDRDVALRSVADLAVNRFADWCLIDLSETPGEVKHVAMATKDQSLRGQEAARSLVTSDVSEVSPALSVLRRGEPIFFSDLTAMGFTGPSNPYRRAALTAGVTSAMVIPIFARGRTYGAISLALGQGDRRFDHDDLQVAVQLGRRVGLFIDNNRLLRQAQEREAELQRAVDVKDEFLGMMSHELRTPLTVISGGARVLRARGESLSPESRANVVADIEEESDRLLGMLENLLSMAQVEFTESITIEPVLVKRLLERSVMQFQQRRPERNIRVAFEDAGLVAEAEHTLIDQVVRNLLSNADKYSPPDSVIEVVLGRHDDQHCSIRVLDRGTGVPPEEIDLIFQRFYRSQRVSGLTSGSGLGLALCKRLVEGLGGEIWARPRAGGGLEVGFTLPLYAEPGDELAGAEPEFVSAP